VEVYGGKRLQEQIDDAIRLHAINVWLDEHDLIANDPLRKSLARIAWLANSVRVRPSTSSWEPPYRIVMVELPQDRIRQAETLKLPTPDLDSFICCKELPIAGIGAVPFG
jgi:hypothetical protein